MLLSHPLVLQMWSERVLMLGLNACVDELAEEWSAACCICWCLGFGILFCYYLSSSNRALAERALPSGEQQRTGKSGGIFRGSLVSWKTLGPCQCNGLKTFRSWKTLQGFWQISWLDQRLIPHWLYIPQKNGISLCFLWILFFFSFCSFLHLYKSTSEKMFQVMIHSCML